MNQLPLPYRVPAMLGNQYMLSEVLEERPDRVLYAAQHTDIRRDVIVDCLRPELASDENVVTGFLATARAKVHLPSKRVAVVHEMLNEDGSWQLVSERIAGEPLERLLAGGAGISPFLMARLIRCLCRITLWMDIENLASMGFELRHCYLVGSDFRFVNPVIAGYREATASRDYLVEAATKILPLLDMDEEGSEEMRKFLTNIHEEAQWTVLTPQEIADEALVFQLTRVHQNEQDSPNKPSVEIGI